MEQATRDFLPVRIGGTFTTANDLGQMIEDYVPYVGRPSAVIVSPESFLALGGTDLDEPMDLTTQIVNDDGSVVDHRYLVVSSPGVLGFAEDFDKEPWE